MMDGIHYRTLHTGAGWKDKTEGDFGEWHNFREVNGKCYGWVKPSIHWSADLTNVGANSEDESVDGITVIWVAPDPSGGSKIVGWYKNARMYAELQKRPRPLKSAYLFQAKASDCVFIDEAQRVFVIDHKFRNLWYAKQSKFNKSLQK